MYAIGSIIGPTLGGTLSDPVHAFPWLFGRSDFLAKYPYWLPCGVAGALNVVGLVIGFLYLEETLPSKAAPPPSPRDESNETPEGSATPTLTHRLSEPDLHRATLARAASRLAARRAGEAAAAAERQAAQEELPVPFRAILTGNVIKVLTNQALINLINISYMAALPLFCYTDVAEGGLSFSKAGEWLSAPGATRVLNKLAQISATSLPPTACVPSSCSSSSSPTSKGASVDLSRCSSACCPSSPLPFCSFRLHTPLLCWAVRRSGACSASFSWCAASAA
jgi:hypothetical protein